MKRKFSIPVVLVFVCVATSCEQKHDSFFEINREELGVISEGTTEPGLIKKEELGSEQIKARFFVPRSVWIVFGQCLDNAVDPFARPVGPSSPAKLGYLAPQERFEEAGIVFQDGAYARYEGESEILTVVNTRDQMELVEAYLDSPGGGVEKHILAVAEFYRVPSIAALEILESVRSHIDHSPERDAVLKAVHSSKCQLLSVPTLLCRSGQRAKTSEIRAEVPETTPVTEDDGDSEGENDPTTLVQMEIDVLLGADEYTVDSSLELLFRSEDRPEVKRKLSAQTTLHDGGWQLLGTWNVGKDEVILIFYSVSVQSGGY